MPRIAARLTVTLLLPLCRLADAFVPFTPHVMNSKNIISTRSFTNQIYAQQQQSNNHDNATKSFDTFFNRFIAPQLDDPFLPLADVGVAQIVAPSLQVFWLTVNHAPTPSWLTPIVFGSGSLYSSNMRGSLLAPTLIHGAALALCWILGALAAKAYEADALRPLAAANGKMSYNTVFMRTIQAGCFGTGLLILATQLDLLLEFHRWVQPGESDEIDLRLLTALVELINDVFFEAVTLISWRLFVAKQNAQLP
ncbi:hypothetical protein MPSEU_000355800 [Mayamaea pseudoterrestris]|nr:hypothetical protein MPSEU_000355800 [Mayamaea pseudoterrestris]